MKKGLTGVLMLLCIFMITSANIADAAINCTFKSGNNSGNIYFTGETAKWELTFNNVSAKDVTMTATVSVLGRIKGQAWSETYTEVIPAWGNVKKNITLDMARDLGVYDVYDFAAEMNDGSTTSTYESEFSYVKTGERNEKIGVTAHYNYVDCDAYSAARTVPLLKKSGIANVRDCVEWIHYEKEKGVYAFTDAFNDFKARAKENDIDILFCLGYGNRLYYEKTEKDELGDPVMAVPKEGRELNAFADYVTSVVTALGDDCNYYELWNEANCQYGAPDNYGDYYKMSQKITPIVKDINPNATVIGIVSSGADVKEGRWISNVMGLGTGDYMDAASMHPYPYFYNTSEKTLEEFYPSYLTNFKDLMLQHNVNRVWITEDSWPSEGMQKDGVTPIEGLTAEEQAAFFVKTYMMADAIGIEKYFWYDFISDMVSYDDFHKELSLLKGKNDNVPYAAKPVFLSVSALNSILSGKTFDSFSENEGIYTYKYKSGDGSDMHTIWADADKSTYVAFDNTKYVLKTDIYGNEKVLYSEDGRFLINASAEPVYYQPIGKFDYEYNQNMGECVVRGYIDSNEEDVPLNIMVYKPGMGYNDLSANNENNAIVYFDQIMTDVKGEYSISFELEAQEGIYVLQISTSDGEIREYPMTLMSKLTCEIKSDKAFADVNVGENFNFNVVVNNPNKLEKEYDVYAAVYVDGMLTGVCKKTEKMSDEASKSTPFSFLKKDGDNIIRAFAFVKDTITPMTEKSEIR